MAMSNTPGPATGVWAELTAHATRLAAVPVRELFERDPKRFERFSREQAGLLLDFSRQRWDEIVLAKLLQLADAWACARASMRCGRRAHQHHETAPCCTGAAPAAGAAIGGADIEKTVMTSARACCPLRRVCAAGRSGSTQRRSGWS